MMASSYGSSAVMPSMDVPQTQNTAPVLEFRCLFTTDLRRKQKRWQDGKLKFHTFNKKVMVYDERSNFVGDSHWRQEYEFAEGEEVELERGGIRVEVGDCIGKRDQDLTELVDKRYKEKEERAAAKASVETPSRPNMSQKSNHGTPAPHLRPKPLNAILTPSWHYGRALLPGTSPFEDRQRLVASRNDQNDNEPPAKRRRQNSLPPSKSGYAQSLMGTALNLGSTRPPSTATIRYESLKLTAVPKPAPIDLTTNDDEDEGGNVRNVERSSMKAGQSRDSRPSRIQKRPQRSPPERSGYANNLIGATLSLSRPNAVVDKPSCIAERTKPITSSLPMDPDGSSSQDGITLEITRPAKPLSILNTAGKTANRLTKPLKVLPRSPSTDEDIPDVHILPKPISAGNTTEKTVKKTAIVSEALSRSPSLVLPEQAVPISKPTKNLPKPMAPASSKNQGSDQPVSSLRIRARAPRKMMMLMDRPGGKTRTQSGSSNGSGSSHSALPTMISPSNDPVLSQATLRLNAFCKKQEERLQARLNGKLLPRPREESEDPSSSPIDSGINHLTIDMMLSRNCRNGPPPVVGENTPRTLQPDKYAIESESSDHATQIQSLPCPSKAKENMIQAEESSTISQRTLSLNSSNDAFPVTFESLSDNSQLPIETPLMERATDYSNVIQQSSLPHVITSDEQPSSIDNLGRTEISKEASFSVREDIAPCSSPLSDPNLVPPATEMASKEVSYKNDRSRTLGEETAGHLQEHLASHKASVADDLRIANTHPTSPLFSSPLDAAFHQQFTSGMQQATDHFRAILSYSSISPNETPLKEVQAPEERVETSKAPTLATSEKLANKALALKGLKESPEPSPVMLDAPVIGIGTLAAIESIPEISMSEISSAPIAPSAPEPKTSIQTPPVALPPKPKLLTNPATRGRSVQALAASTTLDPIAPSFIINPMAPPQPFQMQALGGRNINKVERIYPTRRQEVTEKEKEKDVVYGEAKQHTESGPWSREAFDLFGEWRPIIG